jgi:transcriptional regulator
VYIPAAFAETDTAKLHELLRRYGFAVLTSRCEGGLIASHLPLLLDAGGDAGPHGRLLGHMARANPQWRDVRGEVMAIFSGPHAYVSPSWYEEGGTVPTWNYVAVHAYGTFQVVEERDRLLDILRRSVRTYEGPRPEPWSFDESAPHVETMLKAIVGFRIEITRLEGKWKLSQNHPEGRRQKVRRALESQADEGSRAVAASMREILPSESPTANRPGRSPQDGSEGRTAHEVVDRALLPQDPRQP